MRFFLLLISLSFSLSAEVLQTELKAHYVHLHTDHHPIYIRAYEHGMEVQIDTPWDKNLPSFALAEGLAPQALTLVDEDKHVVIHSGLQTLIIDKQSEQFSYRYQQQTIVSGVYQDLAEGGAFSFTVNDDEQFWAGGQRVLGMDRRGHKLSLRNTPSYGYSTYAEAMYYSLPALISSNQYSIIFDNSAIGELDLDSQQIGQVRFSAPAGRMAVLLTAAESLPQLTQHITSLTGRQPLPPRWALGSTASRFGYESQTETMQIAQRYAQSNMPLDNVVLDLYWFGETVKGTMGNLQWHKPTWPNPQAMIKELNQRGIQMTVITEPFILTTSSQWQSAVTAEALATNPAGLPYTYDFYFGHTGLVDIFSQRGQQWFMQYYRDLYADGVRGWWGDLGEPEVQPEDILHDFAGVAVSGREIRNSYGHMWAKTVQQTLQDLSPNERQFIMMRAGFMGSQRYGMIPWTGDVARSWGGLQSQVELALQMGPMGLGYIHSDLGGFAGGEEFDQELYLRWLQYGVFTPVFRPHAQGNIAPEPALHDQQTQDLIRPYLQLRYQLLPYINQLAIENHQSGLPLMRPVAYLDASRFTDQQGYLFGASFYVQPVVNAGQVEMTVNLPPGTWYDFWEATPDQVTTYRGKVKQALTLDKLPVYVKAGSIIPMHPVSNNTQTYQQQPLTLHIYPLDQDGEYSYHWVNDDGYSADLADSQLGQLTIAVAQRGQHLAINTLSEGILPTISYIVHDRAAYSVSINGQLINE